MLDIVVCGVVGIVGLQYHSDPVRIEMSEFMIYFSGLFLSTQTINDTHSLTKSDASRNEHNLSTKAVTN